MDFSAATHRIDAWMDRKSDALNPILVKETRQAMKSRQFGGTFLSMLAVAWILSLFGVLSLGDAVEWTEPGPSFFRVYYLILVFCLFFVVPFGVFWNMKIEFEQNTFEVLAATPLTPYRIVYGKLESGIVQMVIFYSTLAPFICLTYLLGGISLWGIAFFLFLSFVVSLGLSLGAVMLGSLAKKSVWTILNLVLLLSAAVITFFVFVGMVSLAGFSDLGMGFGSLMIGLVCGSVLFFYLAAIAVGVATSQLTPVNRYLRPAPYAPLTFILRKTTEKIRA